MNEQQLRTAIINAHKAGDTVSAQKLADVYNRTFAPVDLKNDPAGEPGFTQGLEKSVVDAIEGVSELFGNPDPLGLGDRSEFNRRVEQNPAGQMGNVVGNIGITLPAMLIPGSNTVTGSALIGAGMGGLLQKGTAAERGQRALSGAAGGAAGALLPRALGVGARALSGFTKKGKEAMVGQLLVDQSGDDLGRVMTNLANARPLVPGTLPTVAERAQHGGISATQRMAEQADKTGKFAARKQMNAGARREAVSRIAGDELQMASAEARREAMSGPLYEAAKRKMVDIDPDLLALLDRPSMKSAFAEAERLAAEAGTPIDRTLRDAILNGSMPAKISGEGLHYLKLGLDELKTKPNSSLGKVQMRALGDTTRQFEAWREKNIPVYNAAQQTFRRFSRPIDRMKTGQLFADKINPALSDFGPYIRENKQMYSKALRELDQTVQKATGFKGSRASDVLNPSHLRVLENVAADLNNVVSAEELGRGIGSNTFQNLFFEDLVSRAGLPKSLAGPLNVIAGSRPIKALTAPMQDEMQSLLTEALLDPKRASKFMQDAILRRNAPTIADRLGFLPAATGIGLLTYEQ